MAKRMEDGAGLSSCSQYRSSCIMGAQHGSIVSNDALGVVYVILWVETCGQLQLADNFYWLT